MAAISLHALTRHQNHRANSTGPIPAVRFSTVVKEAPMSHCANATAVATYLRGRGLPVRQPVPTAWLSGPGGIVVVDLPSREAAFGAMRGFRLFRSATSLGDCHSLVLHPASTSHREMDDAGLARAGISVPHRGHT